jgi:predicted amidohydrolase
MKVAGLQVDLVWEDVAANHAALAPQIRAAAAQGAELIVLPEMFATGFSMNTNHVAEAAGGPSEVFLRELAQECGAALFGSVATRPAAGERPLNLGLVARPDGTVARYAKLHCFTFGGEQKHYAPGDDALTVEIGGCRVTPLICYDLRFPELFAALAHRTDLFVVIANWPRERRHAWSTLLQARAHECVCYVLGVNRVGRGGKLHYTGDSALWDPAGRLVQAGGEGVAGVVWGDVDPRRVASQRTIFPALGDRRPDVYRRVGGREPPEA